MAARAGDAPERNPATTPAGYLQNRGAQCEHGAGLARPDARPGKCQEGCGNSCSFDQRHSRRAITGMTRAWHLDPAETFPPTTSDHTCASQKTSIDTNVLPLIVRASAPTSTLRRPRVPPGTSRTQRLHSGCRAGCRGRRQDSREPAQLELDRHLVAGRLAPPPQKHLVGDLNPETLAARPELERLAGREGECDVRQALRGLSAGYALLVLEPVHCLVEGQAPRGERSSRSSCDCPYGSRKAHDDPSPRRRGSSRSQPRTRRSTRNV
jgi:hypothetical protein